MAESLKEVPIFSILRFFLQGQDVSNEDMSFNLHGFCNASMRAYAAVVYLVAQSESQMWVRFFASKTRVTPCQQLTIPRLELLSVLLLARLIDSITKSLSSNFSLKNPTCYTDSQVSLCWIIGVNKEWKQFVQNRVSEIRDLIPVASWRYCPGKENPADLPSRGLNPIELSVSRLWHCGPDWLLTVQDERQPAVNMPTECFTEMKAKDKMTHSLITSTATINLESVIPCKRYSKFSRLILVTMYVMKFVYALKQAIKDRDRHHPVILPREHHLTKLIVMKAHENVCHNGVKETLTDIRSNFWIIKGRSLVRRLIHKCKVCLRYEGPHYQVPPPPPLPEFRVTEQPPFSSTGVDFAGPMYIRYPGNKETSKVWLCLFTCAVIRAVHLELVPDMSTSAFFRCLKRFVARRGIPSRFISDNAQTFKCAAKMLQAMLKQSEVQQYLTNNKILWTFNVDKAPWWGGIFERMVKSTKRCLRKVVGRAKLYYDELQTVLVEIECH